jgi:hypothetical protein
MGLTNADCNSDVFISEYLPLYVQSRNLDAFI